MTSDDLFYPDTKVTIGGYIFNQGIAVEVYSSDNSYFDWAKVKFTKEFQDKIAVSQKDVATVQLGYNGVYEDIFTGYVANPYNGSNLDTIILKDNMMLMENISINNTFLNVTPQELIQYSLYRAGISNYKLSKDTFPTKDRVPICKKSGIALLNDINAVWNLSKKYFFVGDTFYWGTTPEQTKVYEFEYAVNIISLTKEGTQWRLETVSAPFIKHSHKIKLTHPKLSGIFNVTRVVFKTNDAGFVRTYIYF